jgi:hypothetical protein
MSSGKLVPDCLSVAEDTARHSISDLCAIRQGSNGLTNRLVIGNLKNPNGSEVLGLTRILEVEAEEFQSVTALEALVATDGKP